MCLMFQVSLRVWSEVIISPLMSLATGTRLGPYEIVSLLGRGGMGEVYRAKDTRLGRDVALKVLRSEISADPDRRARFEREGKTVAALSHPNIVSLFEVGSTDGLAYTVSELVDGDSLRKLMGQGPLPVRQVVELATQLADGMAAAHSAGIVHRDLKPENVMVTRDGRVKILDFGLARVLPGAAGSGSGSGSGAETMTALGTALSSSSTEYMTKSGVVLGTAAYMSPEQARGQESNYRSDQFSFGLMVYEMLEGQQAFVRDSSVETMAAIVRDEAEPLKVKIPVPLKWLLERCLEKDPTRRFDSSRDLYQQLRVLRDHFSEAFSSGTGALSPEVAAAQQAVAKGPDLRVGVTLALMILAAGLAGGIVWWLRPKGVQLSDYQYTPFAVNAHSPLWSPNGKMAVYTGEMGDEEQLFLRTLDSPSPQQLTHSVGGIRPISWSPDSSHIFYLRLTPGTQPNELLSVASVGGEPDLLWTIPTGPGFGSLSPPTVSRDGQAAVLIYQEQDSNFSDVYISEPIGSPLRRYPDSRVSSHKVFNSPQLNFSPDGRQLLLIRAGDSAVEEYWLLPWPAGSGAPRQIMRDFPRSVGTPRISWMPDNRHLVLAASIAAGAAHLVLADTQTDRWQYITQGIDSEETPAVSPDGSTILFAASKVDFDIESISIADGTTHGLIVTPRSETMPAWAAHADSLVYSSDRLGSPDIWIHTRDGQDHPVVTRASFAEPPTFMYAPVLSPDGSRVIYCVLSKSGEARLWESSVAGGAPVRLVDPADTTSQFTGDWSPDGKQFAFRSLEADGRASMKIVRTSGGATAQKLLEVAGGVFSWSPDGKWIAHTDTGGGHWRLVSPDGQQHRDLGIIQTQNLGFAKDSKTAYGIRNDDNKWFLFSIDIETAKLRDIKQLDSGLRPQLDVGPAMRYTLAPDGKSFAYTIAKSSNSVWMLRGFSSK
jgi:eukaryotic-like serine/threonine-protein kinase